MEKLLEMAKKLCDQVEIYSSENTSSSVSFEDAKLHDIDSKFQSGISMRIIKDGKLGFGYTKNLINREELLQNTLGNLAEDLEAKYEFPLTEKIPQVETYDYSVENISSTQLLEECTKLSDVLKSKTDAEVKVASFKYIGKIRVMNHKGTNVSTQYGGYGIFGGLVFPGGASGIYRVFINKKLDEIPEKLVSEMIHLYKLASNVIEPQSGKMKVMFMPHSIYMLTWRILSGTNPRNVYEKVSPLTNKVGENIFSEKLTIYDDPLDDSHPGARAFDDEGTVCAPLSIVENGVLKNFHYDLNYAEKSKAKPTGHGYKSSRFGGESIAIKPGPSISHLHIKPGDKSFEQLVKSIDRGIILEGVMGAHSGNILNGDYSVGVSPALYVENGEIIGRVKDTMVAGNIYNTLKNVIAIGDTLNLVDNEMVPILLCDNVSVSAKK